MQLINLKKDFYAFEGYKESFIDWIGKIPSSWEIMRVKYLFQEIDERSTEGSEDLLSVSQYTGVTLKSDRIEEGELITNAKTLKGYKLVRKGDLVCNIMLAWNGSLGVSPYNGITSPAYAVYRLNKGFNERYFHYLFRTDFYKAEFKRNSTGVIDSRLRLYSDDFFAIWSLLPPLEEQAAITSFLDNKTAKIDQAIAQKEKLIELLKERKQNIIQNAVTKGLDPNVNLKDSGIEWIGEIPEHWEIIKLKYIAKINQNSLGENTRKDYEIEYVDIGNVSFENGIEQTEKMTFKNAPSRARRIANKRDTIISTVRTYLKAIDFVDDVKSNYIYSTGFAILQPEKVIFPEFLEHFVKSNAFTEQVTVNSKGMSYPAINSTDLGRLIVVHGKLEEQQRINNFIENSSSKIQMSLDHIRGQIDILKEYKASLIDSAVTGKIKVS